MGMPVTTPKTKLSSENASPEAGGTVPLLAAGFQSDGPEHHDEHGEAHGELGKEIVEGDGEGEVQAVNQFGGHGGSPVAAHCA